jgi:CBS domain-containing protein
MANQRILSARDIMSSKGIVLRPDMSLFKAMPIFIKNDLTGCPVTDPRGRLLGILSELDCMKIITSDAFHADEDHTGDILVEHFMTTDCQSVTPELGIFRIAQIFFEHTLRRLPVVENDVLIGQVTRADVLKGIQMMRRSRPTSNSKSYPDFAWRTTTLQ